VTAVTGRANLAQSLKALGASSVIGRDEVMTGSGKGLDSQLWAGAIDAVGGEMLAELLKKIRYHGAVAALGNAGGVQFSGSVIPFILRGIALLGIDSAMQPMPARLVAWERLASTFVADRYAP